MEHFTYEADDEAATAALGAALADALPAGSTVALCGTLGAGKTRLVQAIAAAAGVDRRSVVSPTFVLIQEYAGRVPVYHIDAYRLRDEDEFRQLGPEEYFEGRGLVLIEWADRVRAALPAERHGNRHHGDRPGNRGGLPSRPSAAAMPRCSTRWRPGSVETGSALSSQERASQRRRSAGFRRRRRAQRYDEYPRRCLQAVADGHLHLKRAPRAGRGRT